MRERLKFAFYLFCVITTAQVIFISVLSEVAVDNRILYGIIITAFVGVLPGIIFNTIFTIYTVEMSRRIYFFITGAHFILTASLVFTSLNHFGVLNQYNTIRVIIGFLIIYIGIQITLEMRAKKTADELNKRINATHQD